MTTARALPSRPLQRQRGAPLHHQVFLLMRDAIQGGRYAAGALLPSEAALAAGYGVSRVTLRNAMSALQAEGLVDKRQGVGTFVSVHATIDSTLHAPHADLLAHIRQVGTTTRARFVSRVVVPLPANARAFFGEAADGAFQRVERVRSSSGKPLFHVLAWLPQALARALSDRALDTRSLHDLLAAQGARMRSGEQIVSAVLADPSTAHHLAVPVGAPLLLVRRFHRDQRDRAIAYVEMLASPDNFQINLSLDPPTTASTRPHRRV